MKLLSLLFLLLTLTSTASASECLQSIQAVRETHYPSVSVRVRHGCYYAVKINPAKERKVMRSEGHQRTKESDSRPFPLTQGGADNLTALDRAIPRFYLAERMTIDSSWDGMFLRRFQKGQMARK